MSPVIHLDRNPRGPPPYLIDIGNPGDITLSHINYTRMCRSEEFQFWSKVGSCDFARSEIGVCREVWSSFWSTINWDVYSFASKSSKLDLTRRATEQTKRTKPRLQSRKSKNW